MGIHLQRPDAAPHAMREWSGTHKTPSQITGRAEQASLLAKERAWVNKGTTCVCDWEPDVFESTYALDQLMTEFMSQNIFELMLTACF